MQLLHLTATDNYMFYDKASNSRSLSFKLPNILDATLFIDDTDLLIRVFASKQLKQIPEVVATSHANTIEGFALDFPEYFI